jgi:aspartate/methionine/tyrosine aminotransferase
VAAFAPFFPPYREITHCWGGNWVSVPTLSNCRPSIELLEKHLRESKVSLFILNDPCNPSGVKLTRQEILDIAQVFLKPEFSHIILLLDEVYRELIFSEDKDTFLSVVDWKLFKSRCFIVLSLSKTLAGAPGMRLGIVYAPDMEINGKTEEMRPFWVS